MPTGDDVLMFYAKEFVYLLPICVSNHDAFPSMWLELSSSLFLWYVGICLTSKWPEGGGINRLVEEDLVGDLSIGSRGWTSCSNIDSSGHCINPERLWKF